VSAEEPGGERITRTEEVVREAERVQTRAAKGRHVWNGSLGFIVVAALGLSIFAVVVNFGQGTSIDRLSLCERDPKGRPCEELKTKSDKARSIESACVVIRKAGYPCPKPGSPEAKRLRHKVAAQGGDAQTSPHTASQPSAPGNGGHAGGHGDNGGRPTSQPDEISSPPHQQHQDEPTSSTPPSSGSSTGSGPTAPPPPVSSSPSSPVTSTVEQVVGTAEGTVQGVTGTVEHTVEDTNGTVNGTVEGVGDAAKCLLTHSC
jgi:hypothetical protein